MIIVFWGLYWDPLILGNYHKGAVTPCQNGTQYDQQSWAKNKSTAQVLEGVSIEQLYFWGINVGDPHCRKLVSFMRFFPYLLGAWPYANAAPVHTSVCECYWNWRREGRKNPRQVCLNFGGKAVFCFYLC